MGDHVGGPDCDCWGCVSRRAHEAGVCVVHAKGWGLGPAPVTAVGSRVCHECEDRMRSDLRLVAERWDAAQEGLVPGQGSGGRQGTAVSAPLPIRVDVVDAVITASRQVWKIVPLLLDEYPDVRLPDDQSTPSIAEWLYRWQVLRVVQMPDAGHVLKAYWCAAEAAEEIARVTIADAPTVELPVPDQCKAPTRNGDGTLAMCGGDLATMWDQTGKAKTVVCTTDRSHMIPWDSWAKSMAARRPRGARPRNHAGI